MWNILEINETKDKVEIKKAYMIKLQKINPEDDEEGFKKLRESYEEAIRFADTADTREEENITPMSIWVSEVKDIYNKFSLRIDEDSWKEVFESDVCFGLDSKEEARNKLLEFLMDYFYLPKKIWLLIDEKFSLSANREELMEMFPENFIYYVMDKVNISYGDTLDYYLFEEIDNSKDYDSWCSLYFKIQKEINNRDNEEAKKDFSKIEELNINHPLLDNLYLRYYIAIDEKEKAREIGQNLLKKYPDKTFTLYGVAEVEWVSKNYELAKEYYKKVLDISPNDYNAKFGLADAYLVTNELKESEKLFENLLTINKYDDYLRNRLFTVKSKIIEELEKECEDNKKDKKIKFSLGWYYIENYRYDDVIKLFKWFKPDKEDENQYFDLLSKTYFWKEDYDTSLKYINKFENNLTSEEGNIDGKQDELKRVYYQKGRIACEKEEYEESMHFYDKCLEIQNDNIPFLNSKAYVLNRLKRYEESLNIIEEGLQINGSEVSLHINKCEALYELKYYREAMEEADVVISIYPYYTDPYLIKMKIYLLYDEYDEMLKIADELEKYNIVSFETDMYKIKALRNKDMFDEAQEVAISILKEKNKNLPSDKRNKINYELAIIQYDQGNFEKALQYLDKAIKNNDFVEDYYYLRAEIYNKLRKFDLAIKEYKILLSKDKTDSSGYPLLKMGEIYEEIRSYDKALELYKEVLKINPGHQSINRMIGDLYGKIKDYDNTLKYFTKQLEIEESVYDYVHRGLFYADHGKFQEAKADYECAMELDPEDPYAFNNLGYLYECKNELEKAIPYFEQAIEKNKNKKNVMFYNNIIKCFSRLGKKEMAVKYCDKAINAFDNDTSFYVRKAKLLYEMNLYNEAIEVCKETLKLEGVDVEQIYEVLGMIFEEMGEYHKAIEWYKKILEVKERPYDTYRDIANVYYLLEDYKNAMKYCELQLKLRKWYPIMAASAEILVAKCYEKLNDEKNAYKNYNLALKWYLNDKDKTSFEYTHIGQCYKGLNNIDEAVRNYEKAIDIYNCKNCEYTACFDGYRGLGEVYEKEKMYQEALKSYKKALELDKNDKTTREAIERIENLLK